MEAKNTCNIWTTPPEFPSNLYIMLVIVVIIVLVLVVEVEVVLPFTLTTFFNKKVEIVAQGLHGLLTTSWTEF